MTAGRYNFEFHRCCHCGQTVSITDTEPCCDPRVQRAKKEGMALKNLSPTTKSLVRLLRRARAHGITPWHVVRSMSEPSKQATVLFANRHIRIRDDGSMVPDMFPRCAPEGGLRTDPHWQASMYARMYEGDIAHAAYCRRMRWIENGHRAIRDARVLRVTNRI